MSNQKIKVENYTNLGGINNKLSPFDTGPFEFLDLKNVDFQIPGALMQRWGSTMYVGQTFIGAITSLYEFTRLDGSSYVIIGHSGGLWMGATTGNSRGESFTVQGVTQAQSVYFPMWTRFTGLATPPNPFSGVNRPPYYLGTTPFYDFKVGGAPVNDGGSTFLVIDSMPIDKGVYDFVTFQGYLFGANGSQFFKSTGTTTYFVGVPPATVSTGAGRGFTSGAGAIGVSFGQIALYGSYINNRGLEGQIWPVGIVVADFNGVSIGTSFISVYFNFNTPLGFGISAINIYTFWAASSLQIVASGDAYAALDIWNKNYTFYQSIPASGSTLTPYVFSNSPDATANNGREPTSQEYTNLNFAVNTTLSTDFYGITLQTIQRFDFNRNFPQQLEVYQNRLFASGFSSSPSTVWFSATGEPEGFFDDSNFEVRTNDGDYITCTRSYSTKFYILKLNSFHALYGDNPDNFFVQQISNQYGCLNNRCAVVYDDILLFLDRKGLVKYNGASIEMISDSKVQQIFQSMNFSAALSEACVEHDKLRNQIVISIPINGSTINNIQVVYDYLVGAWTTYDGVSTSSLKEIQGRNVTKNLFYGSYSGMVSWYGPSFLTDNGTGITTYIKSRFIKPLGESIQEQFRRLYLNVDAQFVTLIVGVNFYQDYGPSMVLGRTMVISQYQKRIDFGICATAMAFELYQLQTVEAFKLFGFTVESRLQRRVSGKN